VFSGVFVEYIGEGHAIAEVLQMPVVSSGDEADEGMKG